MTIDERIEALAMHLEVLTGVHEDFEKKMTAIAVDMNDAIKRLTNIAEAHSISLDDHEDRIKKLEG
jgi:hypothetical protein